ncbi:MAG: valine--tRNA ligase [Lentisphaeria bacterium]|nr:valine--tRNA ligase [Lentisphaeria bacterium]
MSAEMAKAYSPAECEKHWYPQWEDRGYFYSDSDSDKEPYTIVIPPPNVTGVLHLGHVLNNTLQDILCRFERMRGKNVCWVPGTDHAGIATQSKVEQVLKKEENLTRYDLGREKFLERVWDWKDQYGGTIIRQLRTLGCSCDWRRERFTLDEGLSEAVLDVFVHLYEKGYIYRGKKIINWCPKSRTALSDEEVIYKNVNGHFWYINYPLADGSGHVTVATTRPETMLGDTAVAVNPLDERFKGLIGKKLILPIVGREIPIIADDYVKSDFGTGAVKITPAHDPNDYQIGERHDLPVINLMHEDATMNGNAGKYEGLDRYACRKALVADLEGDGFLVKIEDYAHEVGYSERGDVPVEPRISQQWFVKMEELAAPALAAVADGSIKFHPPHWVNTYNHWLNNIRDWCISRQLWWGHRIPAWYATKDNGEEVTLVRKTRPKGVEGIPDDAWEQESDVLDTWFSSWLWPFSVFDWPEENKDLDYYYSTDTLVTGPDIIFFWVARMIMSGIEFMDDIPFKNVYFTSIIRDDIGRKLSKSLGNSPDPLNVIDEYGADALRYTMIYLAPVGTDIRYSNEKCQIGRNFANKLWNAARFRQMQGPLADKWENLDDVKLSSLRPDDQWILHRVNESLRTVTKDLNDFDFHSYAVDLYEFVWNEFCDWYVESAKAAFYSDDEQAKQLSLRIFDFVFSRVLRMMHPVMPFITEEIYHKLGYVADVDSIMVTDWPAALDLNIPAETIQLVVEKFELIRRGRNLRGSYNIATAQKIPFTIKPTNTSFASLLLQDPKSVRMLLNASELHVDMDYTPADTVPSGATQHGIIYMPLDGIIDIDAELSRLNKQKDEVERHLSGIDKKLSNENFVNRAKAEVVSRERERRLEFAEKLEQLNSLISSLQGA